MRAAPTQDGSIRTDISALCTECPAGTGVARLCSLRGRSNPLAIDHQLHQNVTEEEEEDDEAVEEMATKCEPCVSGATFSDSASRHWPCRACRTCPPNSRVKRECNATHDTECECDRDHYQEISYQQTVITNELAQPDEGVDDATTLPLHARHKHGASFRQQQPIMTCKSCDLCPHGYGAARPCSSTHNTICRKCPTSTYSSVLSATHGCSVCTVCRDDQVTLNECTPIQDTVCAGRNFLRSTFCFVLFRSWPDDCSSLILDLIGIVIFQKERHFFVCAVISLLAVSSEMLTLITRKKKKRDRRSYLSTDVKKMWNRVDSKEGGKKNKIRADMGGF